jgi:two-component system, NtrC family, sensor kinase
LRSIEHLFGGQERFIFQVGEDGLLHIAAAHGPNVERLRALFPIPVEGTANEQAIRERRLVRYADVLNDPGVPSGLRETARRFGQNYSMVVAPMLWENRAIGSVFVGRTSMEAFSDKECGLLRTFADQAVIAIQNARMFEQVEAKTRELSQSLDDLRAAQDRLVQTEKLASLGQLTAGIAHEIKNPLNFVNNFSALSAELIDELDETLAPAPLDQKMRGDVGELTQMLKSNLDKVVHHGKRADSIVKNMLLHSRESSGEHRPADINAIVDESLNLAYHGARAEKAGFSIALQRDLDPAAGMADVYPQEIARALLNLISNGFYATTKRKEEAGHRFEPMLFATTKNLGDKVEIRIRDNGTGIPDDVKEKIFNPFFTTKPTGEGTGLGLSMSHDIIVKQHGGSIDVATEPGVFTEFKIVLPRASQM